MACLPGSLKWTPLLFLLFPAFGVKKNILESSLNKKMNPFCAQEKASAIGMDFEHRSKSQKSEVLTRLSAHDLQFGPPLHFCFKKNSTMLGRNVLPRTLCGPIVPIHLRSNICIKLASQRGLGRGVEGKGGGR